MITVFLLLEDSVTLCVNIASDIPNYSEKVILFQVRGYD
jgi:hypothetical protein